MENKCEKCGGELINGQMAGIHGMFFYPEGEILDRVFLIMV